MLNRKMFFFLLYRITYLRARVGIEITTERRVVHSTISAMPTIQYFQSTYSMVKTKYRFTTFFVELQKLSLFMKNNLTVIHAKKEKHGDSKRARDLNLRVLQICHIIRHISARAKHIAGNRHNHCHRNVVN